jgi:hypothetical protein
MPSTGDDEKLWTALCAAETAFYEARMALLRKAQDLTSVIGEALDKPAQRGTALRLLQILPEERIRPHVSRLVDLASVGHADIEHCRAVLERLDRDWLIQHLEDHVKPILRHGGEEEYRRIAELYTLLSADLLATHLARCAGHAEAEVQEIATDFATG